MFRKTNYYVVNFVDYLELRLEDEKGKVLNTIDLDILDNKVLDKLQLKYLINKLLADTNTGSNILVRITTGNNIFRVETIKGLKEEEVESYFHYNQNEILPISLEQLVIRCQYWNEQLLVFGIENEIKDLFCQCLQEIGYKNFYITSYISEIISYFSNNNLKNVITIRLDKSSFEIIVLKNSNIDFYKYKIINNQIDIIDSFTKIKLEDDGIYENLIFGNEIYINAEKIKVDQLFSSNFDYKNIDVKNYFGD